MEGRLCSAMPEIRYLHTLVEPWRSEEETTLPLDHLLELNIWHKLIEITTAPLELFPAMYCIPAVYNPSYTPPCSSSLPLVYISPMNSPCVIPVMHSLLHFPCRAFTALSFLRLPMTRPQT